MVAHQSQPPTSYSMASAYSRLPSSDSCRRREVAAPAVLIGDAEVQAIDLACPMQIAVGSGESGR